MPKSHIFLLICLISLLPALPKPNFTNPVIPSENNPDPGAIFYNGSYYVATTANDSLSSKFPIHKSADLQNWEHVGYIFTSDTLPPWTNSSCSFWAPEIHLINSTFTVYFAAREASTGILCVGVATSSDILGPYKDIGSPLIKNMTVGSIDPTIMTIDNGTHYVLWKDDGNAASPQIPCCIWISQLTSDGQATVGKKNVIFCNTLVWEGAIVEAPWVVRRGLWYYLFYSGGFTCDATYAVGVARSMNPLGPYEKRGDPILHTNEQWIGPGHCSVMHLQGTIDDWAMIYHSWIVEQVCENYYDRVLMVSNLLWGLDAWPYINGSSPSLETMHLSMENE